MNLTSLFNFNYLKENIKKSKAIILLCILLLPIINSIIFLMNCSDSYNNFMPSIYEVSILNLIGLYFVPIILSITLFNFVYKRTSSDFVLSMPLNKKQIFLTNTIGGIVIIFLMQIVNLIIIYLISLIYSSVIISYRMLFDIFIMYFISYLFVFTSCNIAVSVSSNKITTVVVTILILFLIPFISSFINTNGFTYNNSSNAKIQCINDSCKPLAYQCNNVTCEIDKTNNLYKANITKIYNNNYTLPYGIIYSSLFDLDANLNIKTSLIKMSILTIIYILVGLILFIRKKFEVVGTSFRSEKAHILVRTLTTTPIICITYIIIKEMNFSSSSYELFSGIFLIVLIFAYLIIYDLITRKKITNFFKMTICIVVVALLVVISSTLFDDEEYNIKAEDVDMITFTDNSNNTIGSTKNQKIIDYTLSLLMDTSISDEIYNTYHINAIVGRDNYSFNIYATKENYNYISEILNNDKEFIKTSTKYKNINIFGIEYKDKYTNVKNNSKLADMIINKCKNNKNVFLPDNSDNELFQITLYSYDNYKIKNTSINVSEDKNLSLGILRNYNSNTKKFLNSIDSENDIYTYYINGNYSGYSDAYYKDISSFIINNIDDDIDINKEYSYIIIYGRNSKCIFVTNKVSELKEITEKYENNNSKDDDLVM